MKRQSGTLAFTKRGGAIKLMLVTPNGGGSGWLIPKGNVMRGMGSGDSAQKEAFEEAGITGVRARRPSGFYTYTKKGCVHRVAVFVMKISKIEVCWDEQDLRSRKLFSLNAAQKLVKSRRLARLIGRLPELAGSVALRN